MARFKVGVQLQPQQTSVADLRAAWRRADESGLDSIWTWDHFFPLFGVTEGEHYEGWTLLAAMAVETQRAQFGMLVSSVSYRNPDLVADMARTVDHLSGGRHVLGVGAGWFRRDYDEYGYEFGSGPARLKDLEAALERIKARLAKLDPPPIGALPIMIGGGGEKVTLRLVARYADIWNGFGSDPDEYAHKNRVLDEWCRKLGRDPAEIERSVLVQSRDMPHLDRLVAAGAHHVIVGTPAPYDLAAAERALEAARA